MEEHKHNFIYKEEKDDTLLYGVDRIGYCSCGARTAKGKVQIRYLITWLMKWNKVNMAIEDLSPSKLVQLVEKEKAITDYNKFTEGHAREWLDNLDKYL